MKYRKEERLDIARRVYDREMTVSEAAIKYDISPDTVKGYLRLYRTHAGLPPVNRGGGASLLRNAATLGIKSESRHYKYKKPGDPFRIYPNLLMEEMQVDGPLQCVVSDMTAFYVKGVYHELVLYMDLWNNEIIAHSLSSRRGDRMTYLSGLRDLIELKEQHPQYQTILHTDQGTVYASKAFNELLPMYGITRSMSRAGTPTDNAAMESINGWIKAEIFRDFHVTGEAGVAQEVDEYIRRFNEERPAYSLNYMTPKQYREAHAAGRTGESNPRLAVTKI